MGANSSSCRRHRTCGCQHLRETLAKAGQLRQEPVNHYTPRFPWRWDNNLKASLENDTNTSRARSVQLTNCLLKLLHLLHEGVTRKVRYLEDFQRTHPHLQVPKDLHHDLEPWDSTSHDLGPPNYAELLKIELRRHHVSSIQIMKRDIRYLQWHINVFIGKMEPFNTDASKILNNPQLAGFSELDVAVFDIIAELEVSIHRSQILLASIPDRCKLEAVDTLNEPREWNMVPLTSMIRGGETTYDDKDDLEDVKAHLADSKEERADRMVQKNATPNTAHETRDSKTQDTQNVIRIKTRLAELGDADLRLHVANLRRERAELEDLRRKREQLLEGCTECHNKSWPTKPTAYQQEKVQSSSDLGAVEESLEARIARIQHIQARVAESRCAEALT